jgi:hypothetical protein
MKRGDPKALAPLERDVREALEFERVVVFGLEEAKAKARVLDRVESTVGIGGGTPHGPGPGPAPVAAGAGADADVRARRATSPLWHLVSFGLGLVSGVVVWRAVHGASPPQVVYVDRDRPVAPAPPRTPDAVLTAPAVSTPPLVPANAVSNGSPANALAAERALLDVARSAFGRGEGDEALAVLARHERAFPNGQLAEEREALAVRCLVLTSRADEARARGARFRRRYPTSVMLPAVEGALGTL